MNLQQSAHKKGSRHHQAHATTKNHQERANKRETNTSLSKKKIPEHNREQDAAPFQGDHIRDDSKERGNSCGEGHEGCRQPKEGKIGDVPPYLRKSVAMLQYHPHRHNDCYVRIQEKAEEYGTGIKDTYLKKIRHEAHNECCQ